MGEAALFGSAVHAFAEVWIRERNKAGKPSRQAIEQIAKYQDDARFKVVTGHLRTWLEENCQAGWLPEVAFAWDHTTDTGREIRGDYQRDYRSLTATELAGTADVVVRGAHAVQVYDFKTGKADADSYGAQMGALALFVARAWNVERATAIVVKVDEDGVREHPVAFDAMDLDGAAHELADNIAKIPASKPQPGAHCAEMYCRLRSVCPATTSAMAELSAVPVADVIDLVTLAIRTPEQAGAAHEKLRVIEDAVKAVKNQIRVVVEQNGSVPLANGHVLKLVETTRETFARTRLPPDRVDAVLEELRDLGALSYSKSKYLKECKK